MSQKHVHDFNEAQASRVLGQPHTKRATKIKPKNNSETSDGYTMDLVVGVLNLS